MAARTMLLQGANKGRVARRLIEDGIATANGVLIVIDSTQVAAAAVYIAQEACTSTTQSANLLAPTDGRNP